MNPELFQIIVGVAGLLAGFVLKTVWASVRDLQASDQLLTKSISDLNVLVAGEYVKRTDLDVLARAIFEKLDKIEAKLDQKVNRTECTQIHLISKKNGD
jgi:hypothetical protein